MLADDEFREPLVTIHRQLDRLLRLAESEMSADTAYDLKDVESRIRGELDTIGVLVNFDLRDAN